MADDSTQSGNQPIDKKTPAEQEETNWGADWESAFLAEDDDFFSNGQDENFFLEENEPTVAAGAAAGQKLEPVQKKPLPSLPDQGSAAANPLAKAFAAAQALTPLLITGKLAAQKQFNRIQSFPLFIRIPIYILPLSLIIGVLFIFSGKEETLPRIAPTQEQLSKGADHSSLNSSRESGLETATAPPPGMVRKKLPFPSFIIPAGKLGDDQPVIFVVVDISLIATLVEQEEDLPPRQKVFVRDIIYQFFQNKPLDELRRFSLARGDMKRELRAWLKKQWPEAPIEAIIFHQYHLS